MKRFVVGLVALSVMVAVLAPGAALAQSSTCQAYNPQVCNSITPTQSATPTEGTQSGATGETSNGTLPFTGLDVGLLGLAGVVLLVGGLIVRTRVRRLN